MRKPRIAALVLAAVALGAPLVAYALPTTQESYKRASPPAEIVLDAAGGDTAVIGAAPITGRDRVTSGNPNIAVRVEFSAGDGTTVAVTCHLWDLAGTTFTYMGPSGTSTATANADTGTLGGDTLAPTLLFDTHGAARYEIRHAVPSAGTVDLNVWTFGASTQ